MGRIPVPDRRLPVHLRTALPTALLLSAAVVLAGCGNSTSDDKSGSKKSAASSGASSATSSAASSAAGSTPDTGPAAKGTLTGVTISAGAKPAMTLAKKPFTVAKTTVQVLKPGSGDTVKSNQSVLVDYLVVDGRDGKAEDSTYGKKPVTFSADPKAVLPGIAKGLVDQKIGSRVLVGVPPADGFGSQGSSQLGVQPTDTLLFLLDIKAAHTPLDRAKGTTVTPKAGLPTVKLADNGKPTITMPKSKPSTSLVTQLLIKGSGAKVASGQTISVRYIGALYKNGKVFDGTSWQDGAPATHFPIGVGQVIPGWDKALVGQTVGSQVLLVVPPAQGYGSKGNPQAGITATDTLVFVIDILDAT